MKVKFLSILVCLFVSTNAAFGQTTEFTYQGKLNVNNNPASANYDMQFRIFDDPDAGEGTQQGLTVSKPNVAVASGIFTVLLDFGSSVFATNADKFLEISIRPAGSTSGYSSLAPRQKLTSTPHAIKSLMADNLGGVAANQFVQTNDSRLTDARNPLPGSNDYIQNTTSAQTGVNFNIGGTGTANILNATTQFNINGLRALSMSGVSNLFAGNSGLINSGTHNSFFGMRVGNNNTSGRENSFFGESAGDQNSTGSFNTFLGSLAGTTITTGSNNTAIGSRANFLSNNLEYATAIGAFARVGASDSIVLGRSNFNSTVDKVGIGISAPVARLHVKGTSTGNILFGDSACDSQFNAIGFGSTLTCNNYSFRGNGVSTLINRASGASIHFREGDADQMIINPGGTVSLFNLGTASSPQTTLCRNTSNQIAFCSSSRRYKTNIEPYRDGLNLINQLNPVSFDWKTNNLRDIGLIAEDVAEIEPRLAYKNHNGEIEGVSYSQIGVVLINAVKEQQIQIEQLQEQNKQLSEQNKQMQEQVNLLKKLVCQSNRQAEICIQ